MEALARKPGYSLSYLANGFDWSSLPDKATVVDVGGSHGHASLAIQRAHPHLNFVVQDLPNVIAEAKSQNIAHNDAIRFETHDFFEEQKTQADVYLLRWILHDWPDAHAIKILQNLRSQLRPGDKILINDSVMPKPGEVPPSVERQLR